MHSSMNFHEANVYACKQPIKKQNMTGTPETSWCRVPRAPRSSVGDTSPTYMGTKPVVRPQYTPMMKRPRISISKDLPSFEKPMSTADTKASRFIISIEFRLGGAGEEWRRSQVRQVPGDPGKPQGLGHR